MKAFTYKNENSYEFPEDMEKILTYLNDIGKLHINNKMVEMYYREFCEEYYCAGWLKLDDEILEEFAQYLSEKDV